LKIVSWQTALSDLLLPPSSTSTDFELTLASSATILTLFKGLYGYIGVKTCRPTLLPYQAGEACAAQSRLMPRIPQVRAALHVGLNQTAGEIATGPLKHNEQERPAAPIILNIFFNF
jgi:hypothetical protein